MIRLASVFAAFEADFLAQYANQISAEPLRALAAIAQCRTQASAKFEVQCTECDHQVVIPHSCGHRLCPHCQHHESQEWLERQVQKRLPAEYFLLTFTLPAEFRDLARAHPGVVFDLLLRASWETVRTFAKNDQSLEGDAGAIAVLHTNTRQLDYHPHVHLLMPAAVVDQRKKCWRTKRQGKSGRVYLFPERALAKVFRAKVLAAIEAQGLALPHHHPRKWVVHIKSVGSGEPALVYLGRYLYRGVIAEKDILACENGQVTFRYRNARTGRSEKRTVPGPQFLWLILQHVLPKGFHRVRCFGFLHPNSKRLIALLQVVLHVVPRSVAPHVNDRAPIFCPCCGAVMVIVRTRLRHISPANPPNDPSPKEG
ncbi:IS91 family transposase [Candidatus Accumulibacter contiguus]|jgi:hypothetical protein|uniref:IS91 family transposase n=1 Tax=Candidatus Accumulibacter contiguus TaxID=2954381 RepID=UPI002FC39B45